MKTVAIIQARMASTRLPGKIMADLAGRPLVEHVVDRARLVPALDLVLIATSDQPSDDVLAQHCVAQNIPCFRGSQDDVLDRYYRAAYGVGAEVIVRLTADCPLLDPAVIESVLTTFQAGGFDYVSNTIAPTYPDGLDAEVLARETLERAWHEAVLRSEREHVTAYIWKHPERFRLGNVRYHEDLSNYRWTVDEPQDLEFVRRVYAYLDPRRSDMADVLRILREYPEIAEVNHGLTRNAGYQKSLREDERVGEDSVR